MGHELRRPIADYIGSGLYELHWRTGRVNYRLLYFFHGRELVVLVQGLTKKCALPAGDVRRALERKACSEADPERHTYVMEMPDA